MQTDELRSILVIVTVLSALVIIVLYVSKRKESPKEDKRFIAALVVMVLGFAGLAGVSIYSRPAFGCEKAQWLTSRDIPAGSEHDARRESVQKIYDKQTRNPVTWDCPLPAAHQLDDGTLRFTRLDSDYPENTFQSFPPPPLNRVMCTTNWRLLRQGDRVRVGGEYLSGGYTSHTTYEFGSNAAVTCLFKSGDGASISAGSG